MSTNNSDQLLKNLLSVIHSMILAICTGIIISAIAIFIYKNTSEVRNTLVIENDYLSEESEEDPTLLSRLSNSVISASDKGTVIGSKIVNKSKDKVLNNISAKAYIVANISTGEVILSRNEEQALPIASLTKLATAVVADKFVDRNKYVYMTPNVLSTYGNEGKFRLAEKMRISELFYPLLMVSSNDAAEALASAYDDGRRSFVKQMNDWAYSVGAYRTYFADPTGLSSKNISTVKDLLTITKWIVNNDSTIFDYTLNKSKSLRFHTWINPTHMLNLSVYAGGKNGYTTEANRTSISLFKIGKDNQIYAVIVLGSSRRDSDVLWLLDEAIK